MRGDKTLFWAVTVTMFLSQGSGDPCLDYALVEDVADGRRNPNHTTTWDESNICDYQLTANAWYRFQSAVANRMPETCVTPDHCGTAWPVWMNGTHPTVTDPGPINATVCASDISGNCCGHWSTTIAVKFCEGTQTTDNFYVYQLKNVATCDMGYCAIGGYSPALSKETTAVPESFSSTMKYVTSAAAASRVSTSSGALTSAVAATTVAVLTSSPTSATTSTATQRQASLYTSATVATGSVTTQSAAGEQISTTTFATGNVTTTAAVIKVSSTSAAATNGSDSSQCSTACSDYKKATIALAIIAGISIAVNVVVLIIYCVRKTQHSHIRTNSVVEPVRGEVPISDEGHLYHKIDVISLGQQPDDVTLPSDGRDSTVYQQMDPTTLDQHQLYTALKMPPKF